MWPILTAVIHLGWMQIQTVNFFLFLGLFLGIFVYWRKIKYDSAYSEVEAVDGFLWSLFGGYLMGRGAFILLNLSEFGLNPVHWLNVFAYHGFNEQIALLASAWLMGKWANKHKLELFAILDYWSTAASLTLAIYWLGYFLTGLGTGNEIVTGGVAWLNWLNYFGFHQTNLYLAIFYLILFIYLVWAEYNYRTFDWYKNGRSAAESGYIFGSFVLGNGLIGIILFFLRPGLLVIAGFNFDIVLYITLFLGGIVTLNLRSGRKIWGKKKAKKKVVADTNEKNISSEKKTDQIILLDEKNEKRPVINLVNKNAVNRKIVKSDDKLVIKIEPNLEKEKAKNEVDSPKMSVKIVENKIEEKNKRNVPPATLVKRKIVLNDNQQVKVKGVSVEKNKVAVKELPKKIVLQKPKQVINAKNVDLVKKEKVVRSGVSDKIVLRGREVKKK